MGLNRGEQQLDQLEVAVPGLLETQGEWFIEAFSALANAIVNLAAPGLERAWVEAEAILVRQGLVRPRGEVV